MTLGVFVFLLVIGFWLYCLFDAITTPDELARNLPKILWVLIVLLGFGAGGLLWLVLGRPQRGIVLRPGHETLGPDDDPEFLRGLNRRLDDDTD